jgi:hypothetical protein
MPKRPSTNVRELQELTEIPVAVVTVRFTGRRLEHTEEQRQKMATQITRAIAFGVSEYKAQVKVDFEYAIDRRILEWAGIAMVEVGGDHAARVAYQWNGGAATFVLVEPNPNFRDQSKGRWATEGGRRVDLVSINGAGEVRWIVLPVNATVEENVEAVAHFKLTPYQG